MQLTNELLADHYQQQLKGQADLLLSILSLNEHHEKSKRANDLIIHELSNWLRDQGINSSNAVLSISGSFQFGVALPNSDIDGLVFLTNPEDEHMKKEIENGISSYLIAHSIESNISVYGPSDLNQTQDPIADTEKIGKILTCLWGGGIVFGDIPENIIKFLPNNIEHIELLFDQLHNFFDHRKHLKDKYNQRLEGSNNFGPEGES